MEREGCPGGRAGVDGRARGGRTGPLHPTPRMPAGADQQGQEALGETAGPDGHEPGREAGPRVKSPRHQTGRSSPCPLPTPRPSSQLEGLSTRPFKCVMPSTIKNSGKQESDINIAKAPG